MKVYKVELVIIDPTEEGGDNVKEMIYDICNELSIDILKFQEFEGESFHLDAEVYDSVRQFRINNES